MKTFCVNQHDNSHFDKDQGEMIEQLYKKIGKLEVELDWLKKILDLPCKGKKDAH